MPASARHPAALLLLLALLPGRIPGGDAAAAPPCWRTHAHSCLPIPQSMLQLVQAGGHEVVRAVLPTKVVRVVESMKPIMRSQRHLLTFKVPDVKGDELLTSAELRLALPWNFSSQRRLEKSKMAHVYLVPKSEGPSSKSTIRLDSIPIHHPPREHYNSSINFTPTLSLNVTAALFRPERTSQSGYSTRPTGLLHLEVHLQGNEPIPSTTSEDYIEMEDYDNYVTQGVTEPPQLLLFYSMGMPPQRLHSSSPDRKRRGRRSTRDEYEEETNMIWNKMAEYPRLKEIPGIKKKQPRNACRRQPLYVDFAEINYDTWIVAPNGYEAYQCVGKCFFPVSEHLSPTKHAILQTLVHSVSPRKAARACCVPTRLESISVLYVDQSGVLTYHFNYEDMVVAECGCR